MGAMSRNKGSRFELSVAKAFSARFNREIRRVPLSGGIVVKSDLYDPKDDSFPYFVECKHWATLRVGMLFNSDSFLYKVWRDTVKKANESHLSTKYIEPPSPVVVFKGGDFKVPMAMFNHILMSNMTNFVMTGEFMACELPVFLAECNTEPLKIN